MFSKIAVTGEEQHPLYRNLVEAKPEVSSNSSTDDFRDRLQGYGITPNPAPGVLWNFEKFLVGRDGEVKERFAPDMTPDDPLIVEAIEREL
jgi:glutathione peroxidase